MTAMLPALPVRSDAPALVAAPPAAEPLAFGDALALALVIAAALAITVLLRRMARAQALRGLGRGLAALLVAVWAATIVHALRVTTAGLQGGQLLVAALVVGLVGLAALPLLRDVLGGLAFALEGRFGLGDDVRIGEVEGRIIEVGVRALHLRGADGTGISVPYALLQGRAVARLALADLDAPVEFLVHVPSDMSIETCMEKAALAASLSPFASPRRRPEVFVDQGEGGRLSLRIRGYVFDRDHTERYRSDVATRLHAALPEPGAAARGSASAAGERGASG